MQWSVMKTGIERFDVLHAYGLGILLATVSGSSVTIEDQGVVFSLEGTHPSILPATGQFLEETVFPLPTEKEIQRWDDAADPCPFSIRLFDGLLAALLTIPGPKVLSVGDALRKQQRSPGTIARAVEKVRRQVHRWNVFLQGTARGQGGWIADALTEYQKHQPMIPCFAQKSTHEKSMSILMVIDAFFGYDLRSTHSDAQMGEKTNVVVRGTRYATLLVFIGASRFLRAQRLAADQVALFLPCASRVTVTAGTALPILFSVPYAQEHALVLHWLQQFLASASPGERGNRLLYQILQLQGAQQPLAIAQGECDDQWFQALEHHVGRGLLLYWRCLLEGQTDAPLEEQQQTARVLLTRHLQEWLRLLIRCIPTTARGGRSQHAYHVKEVRQVTLMMHTPAPFPLSEFFDREEGVLCYGRALRLLGRYHLAVQQDLLDLLSRVRTREGIFPVLARIGQECEFAKGKWKYLLVPTEKDARALCGAIDRHGVALVAGMILLLSSVRYPKHLDEQREGHDERRDDEPPSSPAKSIELLYLDPDQRTSLNEERKEHDV